MKIKGEKIYLKPISVNHAKTFIKWFDDPEVIKYTIIKPMTLAEEIKWIKERKENKKDEIWCIFIKTTGELIGNVGAHNLDNPNKYFNVGIVIGKKKYWGKGYGTDAFKTLIKYLFEKKRARKLILDVRRENKAAIQVYKKCGFKIVKKFNKFWERERKEYGCYMMEL